MAIQSNLFELGKKWDGCIQSLFVEIEKEYKIPSSQLMTRWKKIIDSECQEKKVSKLTVARKPYQNYFVKRRLEMKEQKPDITFGELSTMIASEWKKLSVSEKKKYEDMKPVSSSQSKTITIMEEEEEQFPTKRVVEGRSSIEKWTPLTLEEIMSDTEEYESDTQNEEDEDDEDDDLSHIIHELDI